MNPEDLIPEKTTEELIDEAQQGLQEQNFRIVKFRPGRVFYSLLAICVQGLSSLYGLLKKDIAKNLFLHSATGGWLDQHAAEERVYRKQPVKTQGVVIAVRDNPEDDGVVYAGSIVSTKPGSDGTALRYIVTKDTPLPAGVSEVPFPVEAEREGFDYNVEPNMITEMVNHIPGVDRVYNPKDWITREGTDLEDDESLRERAMTKKNEGRGGNNADALRVFVSSIPGVVAVRINDQHPRGQYTTDVIITGVLGIPSDELIQEVQEKIDTEWKGLHEDILVIAPEAVPVDIDVTLKLHPKFGDVNVTHAAAMAIIQETFRYDIKSVDPDYPNLIRVDPEFGLDREAIIADLRTIAHVVGLELREPAQDIRVPSHQLIVKGNVNVVVERETG